MRKSVSILFLFLCGLSVSVLSQTKTKIGVYVVGDALPWEYRTLLGDNLVEKFAESNQYTAVNRSEAVNTLLDEVYKVQSNGHVDFSQIKNPTKQLAESQICGVSIIKIENVLVFRASLVDVSTAEVLKTTKTQWSQDEINYSSMLKISDDLYVRLFPDMQRVISGWNNGSGNVGSRVDMARARVEENRKFDISYAEFQYKVANSWAIISDCPAAKHYMKINSDLNVTGGMLLGILGAGGIMGAGLGYGLNFSSNEAEKKVQVRNMLCCMAAGVVPGIILLSAAPGCKRKAWKEYRRPYDNAVDELNKAEGTGKRSRVSLQIAPAVNYDYAGVQMRLTFH